MLLILAAAIGLALANTPAGPAVIRFTEARIGILSVDGWITDGLLAIFFFLAAIELKHELVHGELDSIRKAIVPASAALGGVIVPALIYLAVTHSAAVADGWPIPTATDIAFALGVLALAGRGLPPRVRALLLALAVLDDLIAIVIIAVFFTARLDWLPLVLAVPVIVGFALISRIGSRWWTVALLIVLGIGAWTLVYLSGVHPTVAGVALGLAMSGSSGAHARRALDPVSNAVILPLFAFIAALVPIPVVGIARLSPAFWAIVIALPVGKLVGILLGAGVAIALTRRSTETPPLGDVLVVASLGGIGFTVSLLMTRLAWQTDAGLVSQGTIAVLVASVIAGITGAVVTRLRARRYL